MNHSRLYYTFRTNRKVSPPFRGQVELHVSRNIKDVKCDHPDCLSKAFGYRDSADYYYAFKEIVPAWRKEMKERFGAIEVNM